MKDPVTQRSLPISVDRAIVANFGAQRNQLVEL
jgi:hypothetical protein